MMRDEPSLSPILAEDPAHPLTINYVPRTIDMYFVTSEELDRFVAGYAGIDQTFFGVAAGALVGGLVTWLTAAPTGGAGLTLQAILLVSSGAVVYFGWRVRVIQMELRQMRETMRRRAERLSGRRQDVP